MEVKTIKSNVNMSWDRVKLSSVAEIIAGQSPESKYYNNIGQGIPFFQGKADFGVDYPTVRYWCTQPTKIAKPNDILISVRAPVGPTNICDIEACVGRGLAAIRTGDVLYFKYIYFYFKTIQDKLASQGNGSTFSAITTSVLKDLEIPLPPLTTQKRIAEILDAADALRRKDQELLKKYDELAQAIFIDMFGDPVNNEKGWDISALEELCIDIVDCPHSTPNHTEEITDFPCIRTSEMKNGKISWGSMKYLNKENYSIRVKRLVPEAGDIVYAREGTYGEAVLLPKNYHFALGQRTMLLRPNSNLVSNKFLWFQINSDYVYRQAKRKNMGSTVGHVNVADVKKFDILVPPVQLQLKFTDVIANLISSESFFESHQTDKLFDSLIQKAFKGELV